MREYRRGERFCAVCKYMTLRYSPDKTKCSGCLSKYS